MAESPESRTTHRFRQRVVLVFAGCILAGLVAGLLIAALVDLNQREPDARCRRVDAVRLAAVGARLVEASQQGDISGGNVEADLRALRDAIPRAMRVCLLEHDDADRWVYRLDLPRDPRETAPSGSACPEAKAVGHTTIHEPLVLESGTGEVSWAFAPVRAASEAPMLLGIALGPHEPHAVAAPNLLNWGLIMPPLLALLLFPALVHLVCNRVTSPIDTLVAAAKRVKMGDYRAEVAHQGRDELDDLAGVFNDMVTSLRSDPMTDLGNARYLEEQLSHEIAGSLSRHDALSLLMVDIDKLGRINQLHGREVGDRVVRAVGDILTRSVRGTDVVARYVDDDFAIILPGTTNEKAAPVAQRIRDMIEREFGVTLTRQEHSDEYEPPNGATELMVTVTIGTAECPVDAQSVRPLIAAAMLAVRRAKGLTGAMVMSYSSFSDQLGGADPVTALRTAHVKGLDVLLKRDGA